MSATITIPIKPAYTIAIVTWIMCMGAGVWLWILPLPLWLQLGISTVLLHAIWRSYITYWRCSTPHSIMAITLMHPPCPDLHPHWRVTCTNGEQYVAILQPSCYVTVRCIIVRLHCYAPESARMSDFIRLTLLLTPHQVTAADWHKLIINCQYQPRQTTAKLM